MTNFLRTALLAGLTAAVCAAQSADELLARLDRFAKTFHGMKADMQTVTHVAGLDADEKEPGSIVLRRDSPRKLRMLIAIGGANAETVVFSEQTAEIYKPKLNEIQEIDIRRYKDIVQQLLPLGFGVAGADLARSYEIPLLRRETVGKENATYVEMVPKSADVKKLLSKVELWFSEKTDCAIRQKFDFPDGGFRLVDYSNLLVNPNIPTATFDLPKSAHRVKVN